MVLDPKQSHMMEQSIASLREMARAHAVYYSELVNGGVYPEHAHALTALMMTLIWTGQKPNEDR